MGKKDGKRKAADHAGNQGTVTVPWKAVDKDPVALLVAPEVCKATIIRWLLRRYLQTFVERRCSFV